MGTVPNSARHLVISNYTSYAPFDGIVPSHVTHITYNEQDSDDDRIVEPFSTLFQNPMSNLKSMKIAVIYMPQHLNQLHHLEELDLEVSFNYRSCEISTWKSLLPQNLHKLSFTAPNCITALAGLPAILKELKLVTRYVVGSQLPTSLERLDVKSSWHAEPHTNIIDLSEMKHLRKLYVTILPNQLKFLAPPALQVFKIDFYYRNHNNPIKDTVIHLTGPLQLLRYEQSCFHPRIKLVGKSPYVMHAQCGPAIETNAFKISTIHVKTADTSGCYTTYILSPYISCIFV